jgi:4-diphosphocytidyl-2-C-methyl-D-erythritol kinase
MGDSARRCWRVEVPAKINLALHVLDRDEDGYHELLTVFQAVDLWDEIIIRPAVDLEFDCDRQELISEDNLVLRAARRLRQSCGTTTGLRFELKKRIPIQGGMGGGSADAAGTLIACNQIWNLGLSAQQLTEHAAHLGADVPFFLTGGTALGTGRGDSIRALQPATRTALLLAIPQFGTSTAELFEAATKRLTLPRETVNFRAFFEQHDSTFLNPSSAVESEDWMQNDLETAAFESRPELSLMRDRIQAAGARRAMMSGSGSTIFGLFANGASRDRAAKALCAEFPSWNFVPTWTISDGIRMVECRSTEEGEF